MYGTTDKRSVITQGMIDWLKAPESALGLEDVFYGDERLVTKTPAISVEPGILSRELAGMQFVTNNRITLVLSVYHGREGSIGLTRRAADEFAEQVQDWIHSNRNLGGLVVHGYVSAIEGGYLNSNNIFHMGTQLTWSALSKTKLH